MAAIQEKTEAASSQSAENLLPISIQNAAPDVVTRYRKAIQNGCSEKLAEMLAFRQAPKPNTDTSFVAGHEATVAKMVENDPRGAEQVINAALARGYNPNPNDLYITDIAEGIGDPKAFVPSSHALSHMKKFAEETGRACYDKVGNELVKARKPDVDPFENAPKLSKKIIDREIRSRIRKNPDLKRKNRQELVEEVIDQHALKT